MDQHPAGTSLPTNLSSGPVRIERAVLSAYDKSELVPLATRLRELDVEIVSTGGTLAALREAGIIATAVEDITGFGSMLGGRLKTLHPNLLGGILARQDNAVDREELHHAGIVPCELVVVNLYPFSKAADNPKSTYAEAVELIDVGGPTMIRAAAKNHASVAVVCDPADYDLLAAELRATGGCTTPALRARLAAKAFAITAAYDARIAEYLTSRTEDGTATEFPSVWTRRFTRVSGLRYGENPHQKAALYADDTVPVSLARATVLGGKELSYNNLNDLDAAWRMAADFAEPFAAIFKHASPCGAAAADTIAGAYRAAYATDPLSAYGSIIGLNRTVDMECARALDETPFLECVLAPGYDPAAIPLLTAKKARRYLQVPTMDLRSASRLRFREILGGLLVQDDDDAELTESDLTVVTKVKPTPAQVTSLLLARTIAKHAKSNAIVLVQGRAAVGIGAGQTSRVDAVRQAVERAGDRAKESVLASDAFFPMADGVEAAMAGGVKAIIQPGGSKKDPEVIAACDAHGVAMVFSGLRNFRH
ncbi:MAG: bifunctional phosphoribosylaminoimidazolecarboxamide formyltransferase/IMP cyclohydrolase [candidate division Zixibacteria bacterium]|nr:bifunctional phosphoribosylaminoimidazolecarboxamide formyltransferase/IMP cyclohydrolase [candidate division Zixibacteria bacterium]